MAKSVPITGGYSIDATEVTRAQYAAWLATNPDVSYSEHCVGKTTHVPPDWCMQSDYVCQNNCGKHPQVCVDWCDANDYCQAMGKKLCSAIPGEAPYMQGYRNMNNKSEWYRACTSNALQGTHLYPYGDTYDPQACNGHDNAITGGGTGHGTTVEVGSLSGCQGTGAYAGIYDLVGNVQELEDYAHTTVYPYTPKAGLRGGSFWNSYLPNFPSSEINRCDANVADENPFPDSGTGFRCCSE